MNSEVACEAAFYRGGPYWHLYTDGEKMEMIFSCPADYMFGITLLGLCGALLPRIRILTFALMSNHLHVIVAGPEDDIRSFFTLFKERLNRYHVGHKRYCDMHRFEAKLFRIPDLHALRNEIVYVNRNGYVVSPDCTPFSYWWCAGIFFYNPMGEMLSLRPYASLTVREQRELCHAREFELPGSYRVWEGFRPGVDSVSGSLLFPPDFCAIREAESFFRDAHHYFRQLGRDHEAHAETARRLGEKVFLTDTELYGVICMLCNKEHGVPGPNMASPSYKLELARRMHFDYNASNKQIQRMLKLSPSIVSELFPYTKST